MKIKMDLFGDHFNLSLSNDAIWTSMSNGNHKCRLCNKNFRRSIACNVKLPYNSKLLLTILIGKNCVLLNSV